MFDRRLLTNFNWLLLMPVLLLCVIGYINLYSIYDVHGVPYHLKQLNFYTIGFFLIIAGVLVDYQYLKMFIREIYIAGLLVLVAVLVAGTEGGLGAQRWLEIGSFRFQPSEPIKVVVILALAAYCGKKDYQDGLGLLDIIFPALLIGVPFMLIVMQPDLGTALHLAATCGTMLLFIRIRPVVLVILGGSAALALGCIIAIGLTMGWDTLVKLHILKDYQVSRVETFFDPEKATKDASWHIMQSKISIGNGEMFGRGYMEGTQRANQFLPIQHTDFAFSVFAEQWGFVGSTLMLGLFFWLIIAGILVARGNRDRFGSLITIGISSLIFWQMFINVGMVTGILPVVGQPLPFISYGGTSVVVLLGSVGLMLNVSMRRFKFYEKDLDKNPHVWAEEPVAEERPRPPVGPVRKGYGPANNYRQAPKPWLKYLNRR